MGLFSHTPAHSLDSPLCSTSPQASMSHSPARQCPRHSPARRHVTAVALLLRHGADLSTSLATPTGAASPLSAALLQGGSEARWQMLHLLVQVGGVAGLVQLCSCRWGVPARAGAPVGSGLRISYLCVCASLPLVLAIWFRSEQESLHAH